MENQTSSPSNNVPDAVYMWTRSPDGTMLLSCSSQMGSLVSGMKFTPDGFLKFWEVTTKAVNEYLNQNNETPDATDAGTTEPENSES
jgi:hypothetical protein